MSQSRSISPCAATIDSIARCTWLGGAAGGCSAAARMWQESAAEVESRRRDSSSPAALPQSDCNGTERLVSACAGIRQNDLAIPGRNRTPQARERAGKSNRRSEIMAPTTFNPSGFRVDDIDATIRAYGMLRNGVLCGQQPDALDPACDCPIHALLAIRHRWTV